MSAIILDGEIFKWLVALTVLKHNPNYKQRPNNKYELDQETSVLFQTGEKFAEIVKHLAPLLFSQAQQDQLKFPSEFGSIAILTQQLKGRLKQSNNARSRLYNWNLLQQAMRCIQVDVDDDVKTLLVQADLQMVNELLKDIYEIATLQLQKKNKNQNQLTQQDEQASKINNVLKSTQTTPSQNKYKQTTQNQIDIDQISNNKTQLQQQDRIIIPSSPYTFDENVVKGMHINVDKELNECESILELLLTSLSRCLSLSPAQTMTLFADQNKYLAHVLVKGVKSNFVPLQSWLQELYVNTNYIVKLLEQDHASIGMLFNALKPSFLSRDEEVAMWGLRVTGNLAYQLANADLLQSVYQWFVMSQGGLPCLVLALQRHAQLSEHVASLIIQVGRGNYNELFTVQLRKSINKEEEYLAFIAVVIKPLMDFKHCKEELIAQKVVDFWIDKCKENLRNDESMKQDDQKDQQALQFTPALVNVKINAMGLLCILWKNFALYIEEQDRSLTKKMLSLMKKATRNRSSILKYAVIAKLFDLLTHFAAERNAFAPVVYKMLTFTLIENYEDSNIREFAMRNFVRVFTHFPAIPCAILIQPFVVQMKQRILQDNNNNNKENDKVTLTHHQLHESASALNVFDVEFIHQCCLHPKIDIKNAVQLMDLASKLYLDYLIYAPTLLQAMLSLMSKFVEQPAFQQYMLKLIQAIFQIYMSSVLSSKKSMRQSQQTVPQYESPLSKYKTAQQKVGKQQLKQQVQLFEPDEDIINKQKRSLIINLCKAILSFHHSSINEPFAQEVVYANLLLEKRMNLQSKALFSLLQSLGDADRIIGKHIEGAQEKLNQEYYKQFTSPNKEPFDARSVNNSSQEASSMLQTQVAQDKEEDNIEHDNGQFLIDEKLTKEDMRFLKEQGLGLRVKPKADKAQSQSYQQSIKGGGSIMSLQSQMTQNQNYNQNPQQKVALELEKIKQKRLQQQQIAQNKLEEQKQRDIAGQAASRKQVLLRNMALGVNPVQSQQVKTMQTANQNLRKINNKQVDKEGWEVPINEMQQQDFQIQNQPQQDFLLFEIIPLEGTAQNGNINQQQSLKQQQQMEKLLEGRKDEYTLLDLDKDEDREKVSVGQSMRQRQKNVKFLFTKFARMAVGVGATVTAMQSGGEQHQLQQQLQQQQQIISMFGEGDYNLLKDSRGVGFTEIWRFLKDANLQKVLRSKALVQNVLKQIQTKSASLYKESMFIDYVGFVDWLIQLANMLFIQTQQCLNHNSHLYANFAQQNCAHLLTGVAVERLFIFLDHVFRDNPDYKTYFDVQQHKNTAQNAEENSLNEELKGNPDLPVPASYKKVLQKNMVQMPQYFPASLAEQLENDTYQMCYMLVTELIQKQFDVQIMETHTSVQLVTKVKRINSYIEKEKIDKQNIEEELQPQQLQTNKNDRKDLQSAVSSQSNKGKISQIDKIRELRNEKDAKQKQKLEQNNLIMKQTVRGRQLKQQDQLDQQEQQQVGAAQMSTQVQTKQLLTFEEQKQKMQQKEELENKKRHQSRLQRNNELKARLEELREQKKAEEDLRLKQQNQQQQSQQQEIAMKLGQRQKSQEARKAKLKQYHDEQEAVRRQKEEQQMADLLAKQKAEKDEKQKFIQKQNEVLSNKFQQIRSERQKQSELQDKQNQQQKQKENVFSKKVQQDLIKEKEKRLLDASIKQKIKDALLSPSVQATLNQNDAALRQVFHHFASQAKQYVSVQSSDCLQYTSFMALCKQFRISPNLVSSENAQILYRTLTKDKVPVDNAPIGLTFNEFQDVLLRISLESAKKKKGNTQLNVQLEDENNVDQALQDCLQFMDLRLNSKVELAEKLRDMAISNKQGGLAGHSTSTIKKQPLAQNLNKANGNIL